MQRISNPARRRFVRSLMVASLLVAVATVAPAGRESATAAHSASPRTVVRLREPITGFAQDGGRLAWSTCLHENAARVTLRQPDGTTATIAHVVSNYCFYQPNTIRHPDDDVGIALAGTSVLFWEVSSAHGFQQDLSTASLSRPRGRHLEHVYDPASYLVRPRGDGSTLAYGVVAPRMRDARSCIGENVGCEIVSVTGRVMRVVGGRATRLRRHPPPSMLDVAGGRVAVVPTVARGEHAGRTSSVIEIRDARTGALVRTVRAGGPPAALALSTTTLAVLRRPAGERPRIERYSVRTGRRIGATAVDARVVSELDAEGGAVVYHAGREIRVVDTRGVVRSLGRTISVRGPIGLSIDGRRVAWAENIRGRGVVRTVELPATLLE